MFIFQEVIFMSNIVLEKQKHLTLEGRSEIQNCLDRGKSFKEIGAIIGKDKGTISKEVRKNLTLKGELATITEKDGTVVTRLCPNLQKPPYVCNSCKQRHHRCPYQKQLYYAKPAHKNYRNTLTESRQGIALNKESFYEDDRIISEGFKKGQHLYHIVASNNLHSSIASYYRYLHLGYLSVSKLEFPRVVKFKERKPKSADYVPTKNKIHRTYQDFLKFKEECGISTWVEMDTVIGRIGGKVILTFNFNFCNFIFGILLENKTAAEVTEKILNLKFVLNFNNFDFSEIFPVILTDNGGEFSNVFAIENDIEGAKETDLFFCDPFKSSQKPHVEKSHTLFRDVVPNGESFDDFTQETVNLIFSHVNSVKRKRLNGKSPYEIFTFTYSEDLAELFGIKSVPANDVVQSPKLLKK